MYRWWNHMMIKKLLPFTWWQYFLIGDKVYERKLAAFLSVWLLRPEHINCYNLKERKKQISVCCSQSHSSSRALKQTSWATNYSINKGDGAKYNNYVFKNMDSRLILNLIQISKPLLSLSIPCGSSSLSATASSSVKTGKG